MTTLAIAARARAEVRPALLCEAMPFVGFLGLIPSIQEGGLVFVLPFSPALVGNPGVPALHGGVLCAVVEAAAVMKTLWAAAVERVPEVITVTADFLRPAMLEDVRVEAHFLRTGRRVVAVEVQAWQDRGLVARGRVQLLVGG